MPFDNNIAFPEKREIVFEENEMQEIRGMFAQLEGQENEKPKKLFLIFKEHSIFVVLFFFS